MSGHVVTVRFEANGVCLEARPDTVGTDAAELALLDAMAPETRRARVASLQDNCRHACEMLLTVPAEGSA